MSRVGRLAGALLAETHDRWFLVGNLKRPCDFAAAGFALPGEIDALVRPFVPLSRAGALAVTGPWLTLGVEGDDLPRLLAERLVIERTGAVSDRLWRLLLSADPDADAPPPSTVLDVRWLGEMPSHLWAIVRGEVLSCR